MTTRPPNIIGQSWRAFRRTYGEDLGSACDLRRTRDAFYSGAYAALEAMIHAARPGAGQDEVEADLEGMRAEILEYAGVTPCP